MKSSTKAKRVLLGVAIGLAVVVILLAARLIGTVNHHHAHSPRAIPPAAAGFDLKTVHTPLINHRGEEFRFSEAVGTPVLMFFGFTNCAEICPVTADNVSRWLAMSDDNAMAAQAFLVTVDQQRDTAPVLADYLQPFDARLVGLTGSEASLSEVRRAFGAYALPAGTPSHHHSGDDSGSHDIDHTSQVYLFDAAGDFAGTIGWGESEAAAVARVQALRAHN